MHEGRFGECPICGGLVEYYDPWFDLYRCNYCGKIVERKDVK